MTRKLSGMLFRLRVCSGFLFGDRSWPRPGCWRAGWRSQAGGAGAPAVAGGILVFTCCLVICIPAHADQPRSIRDLRLDTAAAIEKSRHADRHRTTAVIVDLCSLHDELVVHPDFAASTVLTGCRARIAGRLADMKRELQKQTGRLDGTKLAGDSGGGESALAGYLVGRHLRIGGWLAGGPGGQTWWMAGSFAPGDEHAVELINLIQTTIHPDRWRVNGGEASIGYWSPGLALVVTADQLTQERIESLLIGLRGR